MSNYPNRQSIGWLHLSKILFFLRTWIFKQIFTLDLRVHSRRRILPSQQLIWKAPSCFMQCLLLFCTYHDKQAPPRAIQKDFLRRHITRRVNPTGSFAAMQGGVDCISRELHKNIVVQGIRARNGTNFVMMSSFEMWHWLMRFEILMCLTNSYICCLKCIVDLIYPQAGHTSR